MDKKILDIITRNQLPVLREIKKEAATALLDEQTPYELFASAAFNDPGMCINLYRSIGEKRPDKETEHITLNTLANIYGIHVLRNKLAKFSELAKSSIPEEDKYQYMKVYIRSKHLGLQVFMLSKLIGDQYPKKLSLAALLFSSGEMHYAIAKTEEKTHKLSVKERLQLNHHVAQRFNLPTLTKQATGTATSGHYQSEIINWSYRYLIAQHDGDFEKEFQAQKHIAEILCVHDDKAHHHLTQLALKFAREHLQYAAFMSARYILYQRYENKIDSSLKVNTVTKEDLAMYPAKSFINWLLITQKENNFYDKQEIVRAICTEIDKTKPTDMFFLIRYCKETKMTKIIWSSCKKQINLMDILQPTEFKDVLVEIIARKDRTINITPESISDSNVKTLYADSFLHKLSAKQIILSPIYEDFIESNGGHFTYLCCAANANEVFDKDQLNIVKMIRHFFRKNYLNNIPPTELAEKQNIVQINRQ